jgi:hypothetical protein
MKKRQSGDRDEVVIVSEQPLVTKVLLADGAVMVVPMERFCQSFIEIELNLQSRLVDGVLNKLRPPRIHGPFLVNPRPPQIRTIRDRCHQVCWRQLQNCGLAALSHWLPCCWTSTLLVFA